MAPSSQLEVRDDPQTKPQELRRTQTRNTPSPYIFTTHPCVMPEGENFAATNVNQIPKFEKTRSTWVLARQCYTDAKAIDGAVNDLVPLLVSSHLLHTLASSSQPKLLAMAPIGA